MSTSGTLKTGTLRGPSAVGMALMTDNAVRFRNPGIQIFDEPSILLGELAAGRLDFAALPTTMVRVLGAKGLDWRIAAIMIWGGLYVCGTDAAIRTLSDLKGRTLNVMAGGSPPEIMLRRLLSISGADPDRDLHFDPSFPTHRSLALAAEEGRSSLCILSEPYVSRVLRVNPGMKILLDMGGLWQEAMGSLPPVTAFFCRGTLADSEPDAVKSAVDALRASCEWVKANPLGAAALMAGQGVFSDTESVRDSVARSAFDVVEAGKCRKEISNFLAM